MFEKRVQELKAERSISFIEARKIASAESEGRSAPGGRRAAAVASSRAAVAGSRSGPTLPATRSIEVQTDLTWPKGQDEPSVIPPSACKHSCQSTQTSTEKPVTNRIQSTQHHSSNTASPFDALTCNKNSFNKPHGKTPDKGKKKPRLTRPAKSDSEIPTSNMFNSLYTEAGDGDGSSSESDCPNPF